MDALRRTLESIGKNLGAMSATHRLLVASVVIIAVMGLALVAVWTGRSQRVDILQPGATPEDVTRAAGALSTAGISTTSDGGLLMVAASDAARARAILAQSGALPGDKATYFEELIKKTDWMNSRSVNERNYFVALQNELGRTLGSFRGVSKATVQLSVPDAQGLGAGARKPSASIAIASDTGMALPQSIVDAAARYVAGSISGLGLDRVQVIDLVAGKPRVVGTDDGVSASSAMEHASKVERETRQKLQDMLAHIPGVVVAVTASVDVKRSVSETVEYLPNTKGTVSVVTKATEVVNNSTQAARGAEPGFGANQTADINAGGGVNGTRTESNDTTTESDVRFGSRTEKVVDPKGQFTSIAVSVNVPKGYVESLMASAGGGAGGGGASGGLDEKAVQERFDRDVKPQIMANILPHVRAMIAQANPSADAKTLQEYVSVSMVPMAMPAPVATNTAGMLGGLTGGGGAFSGGGLIEKGILGLLGVVALGMMISMVRKVGKKREMPTAEELVGLPPPLETVGEVIGEAEEGETAMAGIEVGEDQMQAQKVLEQVNELVDKDPETTGRLIGRWVQVEE